MESVVARPAQRLALIACLALAACAGEDDLGTGQEALISDQAHNGGTHGFYFLAPTVPWAPRPAGVFEPRVAPVVRIDRIDPVTGMTLAPVVTFDTEHRVHGAKVRRNTRRGHYLVRWRTDDFNLSASATYRIRVLVDGRQLGFADVDVVRSRHELRNVDTNQFVPLKQNSTLPIRFRIETRAVDRDGDGIVDWKDNCPDVPNGPGAPAAPLPPRDPAPCDPEADECDPDEDDVPSGARYVQPDTDGDGIGDACECATVTCGAGDACQGAGACEPTTGACTYAPLPDDDADGACNAIDACPADPAKTETGACGCGVADTDSDGDGTADCHDECPLDPARTEAGACGCGGVGGTDTDGDGTADCVDACPADPAKTAAGVCGCGVSDTDSDGDGTPNCLDGCVLDASKTAPGVCGCGVTDRDLDGDGAPSCTDACPLDGGKLAPGLCGCGVPDTDTDGDGAADCRDACPVDGGKTAPGACGCGVPDGDSDGDGAADCVDACAADPAKTAPGTCGCGVADTDADGDGAADCVDACAADPAKTAPGACGCGAAEDPTDTDADGSPDCADACRFDAGKTAAGVCGCGVEDIDGDLDGFIDCADACPSDHDNTCPVACVAERPTGTVTVGAATTIGVDLLDAEVLAVDADGTLSLLPPGGGAPVWEKLDAWFIGPPGAAAPDVTFRADGPHRVLLDVAPFAAGGYLATIEISGAWLASACVASPAPFDALCDGSTSDADQDGTRDCDDRCPRDAGQIDPGACGCGVIETDANGNGVPDCWE